MNLYGFGHGSGIRTADVYAAKRKRVQTSNSNKKYSDELVAHIKWLLQTKTIIDVALKLNVPPAYVGHINRGLTRIHIKPKEMK